MTVAIAAGGVAECEARGPQLAQAVSEWEEELAHLRRLYYAGRFDFRWPSTDKGVMRSF